MSCHNEEGVHGKGGGVELCSSLVKHFSKTRDYVTSAFYNCCGNTKESMSRKKIRDY